MASHTPTDGDGNPALSAGFYPAADDLDGIIDKLERVVSFGRPSCGSCIYDDGDHHDDAEPWPSTVVVYVDTTARTAGEWSAAKRCEHHADRVPDSATHRVTARVAPAPDHAHKAATRYDVQDIERLE